MVSNSHNSILLKDFKTGELGIHLEGVEPVDIAYAYTAYIGASPGDDRKIGDGGDDSIYGGDGHDLLEGNGGMDFLIGGFDDIIYGGWNIGDNILYDGQERDYLQGGWENDKLYGGSGEDFLSGNPGDDWLEGEGKNHEQYS